MRLAAIAERSYTELYGEAESCMGTGDESNPKAVKFKAVDHAIEVTIPDNPFNSDRALAGPLRDTYSVTTGGVRIPYVGSADFHRIIILYICELPKKPFHLNDPMAVFTHMALLGEFDDELLATLGIKARQPVTRTGAIRPVH